MSNVTQHEKITTYLRRAIGKGQFAAGEPLPSEAELCRQFDSSRGTVRQALTNLRREGLISSGRGRRSVVLASVPTQSIDGVLSFTNWCELSGFVPGQQTQSIDVLRADLGLALTLDISPRDPVVSIHRLRLTNGKPAMVERLNHPYPVGKHLLEFDTDSGSIYQHLLDSGVDINNAIRTIDAIAADESDADLLGVEPGAPLLRVQRRAFDKHGTPVEASDDRYLPELANFVINTVRGTPSPVSMVKAEHSLAL